MSNYSLIIGCDVSKSVIDVSYQPIGVNTSTYLGQLANSKDGFKEAINLLKLKTKSPTSKWFFCFENTGSYSSNLFKWLVAQGIPCKQESPIQIKLSLGLRRGKDDKTDSISICQYAYEKRNVLVPSELEQSAITKLKKLLSRRELLVKHRVALKISLKEQKGNIDDDLFDLLSQDNIELINMYDIKIKSIEANIKTMIDADEKMENNSRLLNSVIGVGFITSSYMIAYTNNFKAFTDAKKFACYCGVAPFPNSSGTKRGRTQVSHMANKKIKSILSNCILSSINYDPEVKRYYKRKKEEGKATGIVLNAVKNKLLHRMFAVVKRGTPYVKLMSYA